jgi:hypothetical protein
MDKSDSYLLYFLLFCHMAKVKIDFPSSLYELLLNNDLETNVFLNEVFFGPGDRIVALDRIKDALLVYHSADGDFPEIVELHIADSEFDLKASKGKVVFEYVLGYSNTCAGTRIDLMKRDRVDFWVYPDQSCLIFSFLDLEARSIDEEF